MRLGICLRLSIAAVTLAGCAARQPQPVAARQPAPVASAQRVYYHPAKAAAAAPSAAQPAVCIPAQPALSAAQEEDLFRRFDQSRSQTASDDAAPR